MISTHIESTWHPILHHTPSRLRHQCWRLPEGYPLLLCTDIRLRAFHNVRKQLHQAKSEWKLALRWTWWSRCLTVIAVSIIRRRKVRPVTTTFVVCANFPINCRSSRFARHCCNSITSSCSFWGGNRISCLMVSRIMPRNMSIGSGPSIFSSLSGNPRNRHIPIIRSRFFWHSDVPVLPIVRKLSK